MKQLTTRLVALLCVLSCATLAAVEVWPVAQRLETDDQNGDGRADLWHRYDVQGHLTEIDRDTNFDGTPDVEEYYQHGVLIRRESDRNFNGQTDLVEEFDPETHAQTRSVVDVDYDGSADLLVLFRDGQPVFSKRVSNLKGCPCPTPRNAAAARHLTALIDPFRSDTCVRGTRVAPNEEGCVGLFTSGGLPAERYTLLNHLAPSARIRHSGPASGPLTDRFPHATRAPPTA